MKLRVVCLFLSSLLTACLALISCVGTDSTTPTDSTKTIFSGPALTSPQEYHGWKTGTDTTDVAEPPPAATKTNIVVSGPKLGPPQDVSGWQTAPAPTNPPPAAPAEPPPAPAQVGGGPNGA